MVWINMTVSAIETTVCSMEKAVSYRAAASVSCRRLLWDSRQPLLSSLMSSEA